ncbi:MAG TPA: sigma-70 family RNA polymerase sigma factor [Thermoanaerobaculia bacterium]|nr:sigma-70 family RNA polymerase sigma factor [Thermoanaerobaculia bacterium]
MTELLGKAPLLQSPSPIADPVSPGRVLLESHFDLICQKLQHLSRRSGLPEHETDELRSWALFKLVEDDYRILARWQGRSSFSTYLNVVLVNLIRDYRVHVWGKWRSSAAARRSGKESVLLEQLLVRDGLPFDEVIERMRTEHGVSLSRTELEDIAVKLPRRSRHRRVGEEEMLRIPSAGKVESRVEDSECALTAAKLREMLSPILRSLPLEERRLLKLHYWESLSLAAISRLLGSPQRKLYSLRDRCLRKIRRHLEKANVSLDQVRLLLGSAHWYLDPKDI